MANILLNQSNVERYNLLKFKLEAQGYNVFSTNRLDETLSKIHDTSFDLMIFDLDDEGIDAINEIVSGSNRGFVLFDTSYPRVELDFRCWIADEIVYKSDDGSNVVEAVARLLTYSSSK